ncbi:MAG: S41 family peptidase [Paludibacteraceae bacterium]|nr:S41 family peptidase [Paludibacteraceae bacterium]
MDKTCINTPEGNMEYLWKTIDQKYCFHEEKGIDWQGVHDLYLPQIQSLDPKDYHGLFDLLAQMLDTLQDGHVNLYSDFDISSCTKWYEGYAKNFDWQIIQKQYLHDYRIAGSLYYNTIDEGRVGYIYYSSFSNGFNASNIYEVLKTFNNCNGIVLDVRNNGGGAMDNAYKLASTFIENDTIAGYWQHKTGPGHNDFSELEEMWIHADDMPVKWLKPVIILSNRNAFSATNFFISCMKNCAPNCIVLGDKSGGGGGMPMSYELPNGWMVRFSSIKMTDINKQSIEEGIDPDLNVQMLSTDCDDILDAAIEYINSKTIHKIKNYI